MHLIGKPTVTLEFDEEFATATGPIATELFFPDQDPLTDDPFLTVEGFDTWRRLTVE